MVSGFDEWMTNKWMDDGMDAWVNGRLYGWMDKMKG